MKHVTLGRLLLSNTVIFNCQIASLLAVALLLSDIADASTMSPRNLPLSTEACAYSLQVKADF